MAYSQMGPRSAYPFPWQEWEQHFLVLMQIQNPPSFEAVLQSFQLACRDPAEARWKLLRLWPARAFLELHHAILLKSEFYAAGPPGKKQISADLVWALWKHFHQMPAESLGPMPAVETILTIARTADAERKKQGS